MERLPRSSPSGLGVFRIFSSASISLSEGAAVAPRPRAAASTVRRLPSAISSLCSSSLTRSKSFRARCSASIRAALLSLASRRSDSGEADRVAGLAPELDDAVHHRPAQIRVAGPPVGGGSLGAGAPFGVSCGGAGSAGPIRARRGRGAGRPAAGSGRRRRSRGAAWRRAPGPPGPLRGDWASPASFPMSVGARSSKSPGWMDAEATRRKSLAALRLCSFNGCPHS